MKYSFTVNKETSLITALSENIGGVSLSAFKAVLKAGEVKVNGQKQTKNQTVFTGDTITAFVPQKYLSVSVCEVIFSDSNILIINKPPLFDVENNLLAEVRKTYPTALPAHRLDRNTSGLVVFSLNPKAEEALSDAFKNRKINKRYLAEVAGNFTKWGRHTAYLRKDSDKAEVKISDTPQKDFKEIITEFIPFSQTENQGKQSSTFVDVRLITGRTHQIRAHLAHLGNPVLGDGRYGSPDKNSDKNSKGYALYSYQIEFGRLKSPLDYLCGQVFALPKDKFTRKIH